jgi:hypothetical protein
MRDPFQTLKASRGMPISLSLGRIVSPALQQEKTHMRRAALGAIVVAMFAAPALALTVSDVDTDGDSLVSFAEMTVMYPDLTEEAFGEIDTSDDSFVDDAELAAALEAGTIEEPTE